MTTPYRKRQHHVPRAYLARFASGGKVRVHRRDGTTFEADPINVAVESGFYDIPDGTGGKSDTVEGLLEKVEDAANEPLQAIDRNGRPPPVGSDDREALALLLGLQMTRTTQHREQVMFPKQVTDWAGDREVTRELVAEYLRVEHLGFEPREQEAEAHTSTSGSTCRT